MFDLSDATTDHQVHWEKIFLFNFWIKPRGNVLAKKQNFHLFFVLSSSQFTCLIKYVLRRLIPLYVAHSDKRWTKWLKRSGGCYVNSIVLILTRCRECILSSSYCSWFQFDLYMISSIHFDLYMSVNYKLQKHILTCVLKILSAPLFLFLFFLFL